VPTALPRLSPLALSCQVPEGGTQAVFTLGPPMLVLTSSRLVEGRVRRAGHRLSELERSWGLLPLPYDLGINEVAAVIDHRDVLGDPVFPAAFKHLAALLRQSAMGRSS
jgi:hypothetical protein